MILSKTVYFLYWNNNFQFSTANKEQIRNYIKNSILSGKGYKIESNVRQKNINLTNF